MRTVVRGSSRCIGPQGYSQIESVVKSEMSGKQPLGAGGGNPRLSDEFVAILVGNDKSVGALQQGA
jgi:hypothetical protein